MNWLITSQKVFMVCSQGAEWLNQPGTRIFLLENMASVCLFQPTTIHEEWRSRVPSRDQLRTKQTFLSPPTARLWVCIHTHPQKSILRSLTRDEVVLLFFHHQTRNTDFEKTKNMSDWEATLKIDYRVIMMGKIKLNMSNHRIVYHGK